LGQKLHHQMMSGATHSVQAEFGLETNEEYPVLKAINISERFIAEQYHKLAELLALGAGLIGIVFAYLIYYRKVMDPAEAAEQFPSLYRFLQRKWYFDELYSVMLVRPAMIVAGWCRSIDLSFIDGFINWLASFTLKVSRFGGTRIDANIVD